MDFFFETEVPLGLMPLFSNVVTCVYVSTITTNVAGRLGLKSVKSTSINIIASGP